MTVTASSVDRLKIFYGPGGSPDRSETFYLTDAGGTPIEYGGPDVTPGFDPVTDASASIVDVANVMAVGLALLLDTGMAIAGLQIDRMLTPYTVVTNLPANLYDDIGASGGGDPGGIPGQFLSFFANTASQTVSKRMVYGVSGRFGAFGRYVIADIGAAAGTPKNRLADFLKRVNIGSATDDVSITIAHWGITRADDKDKQWTLLSGGFHGRCAHNVDHRARKRYSY